jgi:hypothetical protein
MQTGIQFRGTVPANQTHRWFTFNWNPAQHVIWTVVPVSINTIAPEITWSLAVQRTSNTAVTYWISIINSTNSNVDIEARYAIFP